MKNRIIYILTTVALLSSVSCSEWLNVSPKSEVAVTELFTNEGGFKDAVIGCYIKLKDKPLYGKSLTFHNIEYLAQHWEVDPNNTRNEMLLRNFDYTASSSIAFFEGTYSALYNVIVQANLVLENLEKTGDVIKEPAVRDAIKAEMLTMRAFCHFDILRLFGQLPNNPTKKVSLPYVERVTLENLDLHDYTTFVAKLEKDLTEAEGLLKNSDPVFQYTFTELNEFSSNKTPLDIDEFFRHRKFRFNYYAVKALQARMYLYIGNKSKAAEAARTVIEAKNVSGARYVELSGAAEIAKGYHTLPSECLFAISNAGLKEVEISELFNTNSVASIKMSANKLNNDLFGGASTHNRRDVWSEGESPSGPTPYITKYDMRVGVVKLEETNMTERELMPILRLSEMYLIAMECSNSLTEINTLYIEFMKARDILTTGFTDMNEVANALLNEYRREFFAEGVMFYTYKRLGAKKMLWRTEEVTEENYIAPAHRAELKN